MNEATMVYRAPGEHLIHGFKVDYAVVDAHEVDDMLAEGWFRTATEAGQAVEQKSAEPSPEAVVKPPTRADLELKAAGLGLKFDGRTSDKRLSVMVNDALRAKG